MFDVDRNVTIFKNIVIRKIDLFHRADKIF